MSPTPDHDPLRDGLRRRASHGTPTDPGRLYGRARDRADRLYRRQVGAGLAATVLVVGALVGAVTLHQGRATVGTEVGSVGSDATTSPTSFPGVDGSTTTVGPNSGMTLTPCGPGFFSAHDEAQLVAHFGPRRSCYGNQAAWGVVFDDPASSTSVALVEVCVPGDQACLGPDTAHDLSGFRAVYLPRTTRPGTGFESLGSSHLDFDFDVPPVPDGKPFPVLKIDATVASGPSFELLQGCEPLNQTTGPRVDQPRQALTPPTADQALAQPVPDWATIQPAGWATSC